MRDNHLASKISVIVPIYNVAEYLNECINSILCQTYQNIEIILVDDGSTDDSGIIADRHKLGDSRVSVIHKPKGGLSSARNVGLQVAQGDFVVFIDSDDYVLPSFIERLYFLVKTYDADIASVGSFKKHVDGSYTNTEIDEEPQIFSGLECAESLTSDHTFYPHRVWGKIFTKAIVSNEWFPEGVNAEDTYFSFSTALHNNNARIVIDRSQNLYCYRMRPGSIVMTSSINSHSFDIYDIWKKCYEESTVFLTIRKKCARRIIRSYIQIIGKVYSERNEQGFIKKKIQEMNKSIDRFYAEAELSAIETISFLGCRRCPSLMSAFFRLKIRMTKSKQAFYEKLKL